MFTNQCFTWAEGRMFVMAISDKRIHIWDNVEEKRV